MYSIRSDKEGKGLLSKFVPCKTTKQTSQNHLLLLMFQKQRNDTLNFTAIHFDILERLLKTRHSVKPSESSLCLRVQEMLQTLMKL